MNKNLDTVYFEAFFRLGISIHYNVEVYRNSLIPPPPPPPPTHTHMHLLFFPFAFLSQLPNILYTTSTTKDFHSRGIHSFHVGRDRPHATYILQKFFNSLEISLLTPDLATEISEFNLL